MNRFDTVVMVDWSASGSSNKGNASIWFAEARGGHLVTIANPSTRYEACAMLGDLIRRITEAGHRALIGFDFPFGYPVGTAGVVSKTSGLSMWEWIAKNLDDKRTNDNNRFEVASRINRMFSGDGPFWAHPENKKPADIPFRKPDGYGSDYPAEKRIIDERAGTSSSVWQLFSGANVVGSQALTGIASVHRLRENNSDIAVWPFDGERAFQHSPIVFAEIYPSLLPVYPAWGETKDMVQVRTAALHFAALSRKKMHDLLLAPFRLPEAERAAVVGEEGWILGVPA